jgi:hypothetical protein
MLRPPRLLSIIAASCLTFFALSASAQPGWDDADSDSSSDSGSSGTGSSSSGSSEGPSADDFADPTAGSSGGAGTPSTSDPDAEFGEYTEAELDERLSTLGGYLKDIQAPLRAYTGGWVTLQAGLTGFFAYQSTLDDGGPVRASNIMLATMSGVNMAMLAFAPMPGRSAWRKFKKMPEGTLQEKRDKLDAGRRWLSGQVAADKKATEPAQHVLAALVGVGFGAGLLFGWEDSLRPAVQTTLGIILIAELEFATRPHRTRRYNMEFAVEKQPAVQVSLAPLISRGTQGLSLVGRF